MKNNSYSDLKSTGLFKRSIFLNLIGSWILSFVFLSCDSPSQETDNFDNLEEGIGILETDASSWFTYKGLVPCTDCEGIEMELKLENKLNKEENEFELKETYLGTVDGNRNYITRGTFEIHYGLEKDPLAMVITLLDENGEAVKAFVQEEDQALFLLGKDGQRIESSQNYRLSKE